MWNHIRTGYSTVKNETGMTGEMSDLPGWKQRLQEEAEISYPVAKSILEQNSFKQAWWSSLSPFILLWKYFTTLHSQRGWEWNPGWGLRVRYGERGMYHMRMGKTCWVTKFPGHLLCCPWRLPTAWLHCRWHLLPGSLELEKCHCNFLFRETKAQYCWWTPIGLEKAFCHHEACFDSYNLLSFSVTPLLSL